MDGLKTGLTNASGFNLAASAIRNGRRLIGVVFGGTSAVQRDDYMAELLDDGFHRVNGVAMTTAVPPPVPGHKPSDAGSVQVADSQGTAAPKPLEAIQPAAAAAIRVASAAPEPAAKVAVSAGEGDVEGPDDTRPAVAAVKRKIPAAKGRWSIQIGAYATRQATEHAIRQAMLKAPRILEHATAVVAPLLKGHGTVYRARLAGLEAAEARKACRLLSHCMAMAPGAS
jgi:D-alanyl-D-alanine carboxypeptidase